MVLIHCSISTLPPKNILFNPDTLADGYEHALKKGMNHLCLAYKAQFRVNQARVFLPQVYMRLCYIAKRCNERGNFSELKDVIIIFTECLENTSILRDLNLSKPPRFYTKQVNELGSNGWIWIDSHNVHESPLYNSEKLALEGIKELEAEIKKHYDDFYNKLQ